MADLPELVAAAAAADPDAVAFEYAGSVVRFGGLHETMAAVSATMGVALTPEAQIPVALTRLVPGMLPALGADGYAAMIDSLLEVADRVGRGLR